MSAQQNTRFNALNALLEEAKRKGYLLHEDLLNLLPSDYGDPNQMENIIDQLNEIGIKVYEVPPDADTLILEENEPTEELNEAIEVLATETRTTDPVRMYMREMGSVELLTREGEIVIAKRIEAGIRHVLSALVQYPSIIESFIADYNRIVENEGRLTDLINCVYEIDAIISKPATPPNHVEKATKKE